MQSTDSVRIWIDLVPMGRTVGWIVRCGWCKTETFLPQRSKARATDVAMSHSKTVHGGRGVLAVMK